MKRVKLQEAIQSIPHGSAIALGGNTLHRVPMSAVREIIRQDISNLKLIKTAGAIDIDLLCLANLCESVDAGFVSYETQYGLANHYRKAVESGHVKANEHACYTVISALRASSYGLPFMGVKGLIHSDLIEKNDFFDKVIDPFTKQEITVVKAITPDVAIIHVHSVDEEGNAVIEGPKYEDVLLANASKKVIITAERMVKKHFNQAIDIPGFLVDQIVLCPRGADPTSMTKCYPYQHQSLKEVKSLKTKDDLDKHLKKYEYQDYLGSRGYRSW